MAKKRIQHGLIVLLASGLLACQAVDSLLIGVGGGEDQIKQNAGKVSEKPPLGHSQGNSTESTGASGPDLVNPTEPLRFPAQHPVPFTAKDGQYLRYWDGKKYQSFYIKGINLGVGLPGTQAGDLAATREQYARWFKRMTDLGFNSLRIYTLHYPRFYQELARYNRDHPDKPLYIFHGMWLDEAEGDAGDLYRGTQVFDQGIREVIDAVHGNKEIGFRQGRAYGKYEADISRWVMAWIVGREIAPEEVLPTNELHADQTRYNGKHLSIEGNPTEVWATERMDRLIAYEREKYKVDRALSWSSWPTLDPLSHSTENTKQSSEDIAQVDLAQLQLKDAPGGFFASFHAYPYYPNFINNEPHYLKESDAEGVNNYIGYLKELKAHYKNIPLVIGEFGVPSSWGNAHFSPSGMHHGGHDEMTQQRYNARMTQDIYDTGLAGGMVFAWIDEWWKRTWIVDELTMPRERYRLWHNLSSPEENFGLVAFEQAPPTYRKMGATTGRIQSLEAAHDATFFYLRLNLTSPLAAGEKLVVGYDTYADDLGEVILPHRVKTKNRNEFALVIDNHELAQLHVTQPYDLFGIWHGSSSPLQIYQSVASEGKPWLPVRWQNSDEHNSKDLSLTFPLTIFEIGQLQVRADGEQASSKDAVILKGKMLEIRIPWNLLQFTDPSTRSVTHDDRKTRGRETRVSDGIAVSISLDKQLLETARYRWDTWDKAPEVVEREKAGLELIQAANAKLPEHP